jgi:hypothetical protein
MARCPNHDDSQICPDCTSLVTLDSQPARRSAEPRIEVTEDIARQALSLAYSRMGQSDGQGEQARTVAAALYASLATADHELPRLRGGEIVEANAGTDRVVTKNVTNYPASALCFDIECDWSHRGEDTHTLAINHAMETGHPVTVENLTSVVYEVL